MKFSTSLILFCGMLSLASCEPGQKERPSPLRADSAVVNNVKLKIEYSSPAVKERAIWGDLVAYDKIWRTGANDATVFMSDGKISLQGLQLNKGRYAMFTIPNPDEWEIILNEDFDQWGTYQYDSTLDVGRVKVKPFKTKEFSERMKFYFADDSLKFRWENLGFSLAIE